MVDLVQVHRVDEGIAISNHHELDIFCEREHEQVFLNSDFGQLDSILEDLMAEGLLAEELHCPETVKVEV